MMDADIIKTTLNALLEWDIRGSATLLSKFAGILSGFIFTAILLSLINAERIKISKNKKYLLISLRLLIVLLYSLVLSTYLYIVVANNTDLLGSYELSLLSSSMLSTSVVMIFMALAWLFMAFQPNHEDNSMFINLMTTTNTLLYCIITVVIFYMWSETDDANNALFIIFARHQESYKISGNMIAIIAIIIVAFIVFAHIMNKYYKIKDETPKAIGYLVKYHPIFTTIIAIYSGILTYKIYYSHILINYFLFALIIVFRLCPQL